MRALRRGPAFFSTIAAFLLFAPRPAAAHLRLVQSEPAAGATVSASPGAIRLVFSVPPQLALCAMTLIAANGDTLALTPVMADMSDATVLYAIPRVPLNGGAYVLVWRAASADAHPISGRIEFSVAGAATTAEHAHDAPAAPSAQVVQDNEIRVRDAPTGERISIGATIARTIGFASLFALIGAVCFRFLVLGRLWRWQNGKRFAGALWRARGIALGACGLYLVSHMAKLVLEGRRLLGGEAPTTTRVIDIFAGTFWGVSWIIAFGGLAVALVGMTGTGGRPRLGWAAATGGAVILALATALGGHAAAAPNAALAVSVVMIHLLAAGCWLGTLLLVVSAGLPAAIFDGRGDAPHESVAELMVAFSPVALSSAAVAMITGSWTAWMHLPSLSALTNTDYGLTLLLKVALLLFAAALGFVNWRVVTPKLGSSACTQRISQTSRMELTVGALMLAVSAVLVVTRLPGE